MAEANPNLFRVCEHCGTKFRTTPAVAARRAVRFCSRTCYLTVKGDLKTRFWKKVNKDGPFPIDPSIGNCWVWIGATFSNGYGHIVRNGIHTSGHRIAWELENGTIPDGLLVLHKCDRPACVRASHLFLGTHSDNAADMMNKGRQVLRIHHTLRTHCMKGHPLTADNIIYTNRGKARRCLVCYRASSLAGSLRYLSRNRDLVNMRKRMRRAKHVA